MSKDPPWPALGADEARAIYEASDGQRQGVACALKLTRVEARAELLDRSAALMAIDSEHLVRVHDAGHDGEADVCYVATELLKGADLGSISSQSGPLPAEQVATWIRHACHGLDAVHGKGLCHGALSLRSLYLTRRDGVPTVVVINLEEAALFPRPSQLPFRAPEAAAGALAVAADVYAIGHVAYALLTGEPFWKRDLERSADGATAGDGDEPPSARASHVGVILGDAFDRWFHIATALSPSARYASAADAASALELALGVGGDARSSLRKITQHLDAAPLDKTLPSDPPPSVDPLGDTQAGAGLAEAAAAARASAPGKKKKVPTVPVVRRSDDEEEALAPAGVPAGGSTTRVVAIVILVLAALALVAVLAT
jgi:serine/threonine-protein kinase